MSVYFGRPSNQKDPNAVNLHGFFKKSRKPLSKLPSIKFYHGPRSNQKDPTAINTSGRYF